MLLEPTYKCEGVETLSVALLLERGAQLVNLFILLGRQVARVAVLGNGSDDGEVKVVVLWVELHVADISGGSHGDGRWFVFGGEEVLNGSGSERKKQVGSSRRSKNCGEEE